MVFVGTRYGISYGMQAEIELAERMRIPIVFNDMREMQARFIPYW